MAEKPDINPTHLKIVTDILHECLPQDVTVWVFGSRAKWTAKEYSDLDLALEAKNGGRIPTDIIARLDDDFEESDLPWKVDVVDINAVASSFKEIIMRDRVKLEGIMSSTTEYGKISSEFSYALLKNICLDDKGVQTGPFGSQLHQKDYVENGTPIITVEHLGNNRIVHQNLPCVSDEDKERLSKYWIHEGDIVFSRVGSVDRRALVSKKEDGWLFSGRCLRVRPKKNIIDSTYLSYFFGLESFKKFIRGIAVGATMPSINTKILSNIPVYYPKITIQKSIAKILKSLDDKIEMNQRMNKTLEEMAQAIFKCWFVDFEPTRAKIAQKEGSGESDTDICTRLKITPKILALFPATLTNSELGPIPDGWTVKSLLSLGQYINGAAFKKMHFVKPSEGLPVVKIAELKAGVTSQTKFNKTDLGEKFRISTGDVLFSWSGNPDTSIDTFIWTKGDGWLNQHIFVVHENGELPKYTQYFLLKNFKPVFTEIARDKQTTGLGHVTRKDLDRLEFACASSELINEFNSLIEPMFLKLIEIELESNKLSQIRDSLLPKLLSGEISVAEAENIVEGA